MNAVGYQLKDKNKVLFFTPENILEGRITKEKEIKTSASNFVHGNYCYEYDSSFQVEKKNTK